MSHKLFTGFAAAFALSATLAATPSVEAAGASVGAAAGMSIIAGQSISNAFKKSKEDSEKVSPVTNGGECKVDDKTNPVVAKHYFERCAQEKQEHTGILLPVMAGVIVAGAIIVACHKL